jgi:hypothetical protein
VCRWDSEELRWYASRLRCLQTPSSPILPLLRREGGLSAPWSAFPAPPKRRGSVGPGRPPPPFRRGVGVAGTSAAGGAVPPRRADGAGASVCPLPRRGVAPQKLPSVWRVVKGKPFAVRCSVGHRPSEDGRALCIAGIPLAGELWLLRRSDAVRSACSLLAPKRSKSVCRCPPVGSPFHAEARWCYPDAACVVSIQPEGFLVPASPKLSGADTPAPPKWGEASLKTRAETRVFGLPW